MEDEDGGRTAHAGVRSGMCAACTVMLPWRVGWAEGPAAPHAYRLRGAASARELALTRTSARGAGRGCARAQGRRAFDGVLVRERVRVHVPRGASSTAAELPAGDAGDVGDVGDVDDVDDARGRGTGMGVDVVPPPRGGYSPPAAADSRLPLPLLPPLVPLAPSGSVMLTLLLLLP